MAEAVLNLSLRQEVGKKGARHIRRTGAIPGIFYIHGQDSIPVTVDEKALRTVIVSKANLVDLKFDNGRKEKCVIREVQWDPLTSRPLHVDLMGIKLTEKVRVKVAVRLVGSSVGVKEGGILQMMLRELEIECLPLDIPEDIPIDVSSLKIQDTVHVGDVKLERVRILNDPAQVIASVLPPKVEEAPSAEAPAEEKAEPEVIGRKKEEAEGEAAEGKGKGEGKGKEEKKEKEKK
ncbi:MAG: 50S ribosomal protein L25 [candidate division KSB1 bacterium]|nr:50S ribosomal protein L25 [candidate division KSB1 bacterium]MDZ7365271.1 50S ribosomal protein L25 [candidate division KSB1 bacterium]MDZ7403138.1 50S ribosomal protein L25 [candidate division KSB1 bacterium]